MEYRDPIDLEECSSNMEIRLCWYQKGTNNRWYVLDAYELHPGDEKTFNDFINEC